MCYLHLWSCFLTNLAVALSLAPQARLDVDTIKHPDLRGRFLHITDFHVGQSCSGLEAFIAEVHLTYLDPYYVEGTSESTACHRKNGKKRKKTPAAYYGTEYSDCDTPFRLSNLTLDHLDEKWASEIDFVVWTGDTARHSNDPDIPRTPEEILGVNRILAERMEQIFVSRGIPVVPCLGNNDVWHHNIMAPGPNDITRGFSSAWRTFIPPSFAEDFRRGAYYSAEVIPNELAVIALNTLYFFESNEAVGGCEFRSPEDAGNVEFDWLEAQLENFRRRNMQVWISGHIPPTEKSYYPECVRAFILTRDVLMDRNKFVRYVELSLRFQDTILGHLFGHMNYDHFFFLEADDLLIQGGSARTTGSGSELFKSLISDFSELRKRGDRVNEDDYVVINISPSVVPILQPSFRIYSYNVSGAKYTRRGEEGGRRRGKPAKCKKKRYKHSWKCKLDKEWHSDPESPSRSNKLWSPLGYSQYYLPDLHLANATERPEFELEYVTYPSWFLDPESGGVDVGNDGFQLPVPLRSLRLIRESKRPRYDLRDLTIPSWIGLAQRLGNGEERGLRRAFKRYIEVKGSADCLKFI